MSSNLRIKRICAWCGKEFIAQKTTTACCFKQCANALYKKRKRDEAIKANNQIVEKKIEEKPIERIKDKPFLTITETAIYLGVTRPTVYGYINHLHSFGNLCLVSRGMNSKFTNNLPGAKYENFGDAKAMKTYSLKLKSMMNTIKKGERWDETKIAQKEQEAKELISKALFSEKQLE